MYSFFQMSETKHTRMSVTFPDKLAAKIQTKASKKKWSQGQVIRDCVEIVLTPAKKSKSIKP